MVEHPITRGPLQGDRGRKVDLYSSTRVTTTRKCAKDPLHYHRLYSGVRSSRDACRRAFEDDIVSHDSIGDHLDAFAGVPDAIVLDDVDSRSAAVDEDTRIPPTDVRIVNHVVPDRIAVGTSFDLDAIVAAVACAAQMMDIVALH